MNVGQARAVARQWVIEEGSRLPGFAGGFFHGSMTWLPAGAPLPATSDVDMMIVLADTTPPEKLGKFTYQGVRFETSSLPRQAWRSADQALGQYHLAVRQRTASVILDAAGKLAPLQAAVVRGFAKRCRVRRRRAHARDRIIDGFRLDENDPFRDQVVSWLFPAGITTHVLLVAGLRNPAVRTRYLAARSLALRSRTRREPADQSGRLVSRQWLLPRKLGVRGVIAGISDYLSRVGNFDDGAAVLERKLLAHVADDD